MSTREQRAVRSPSALSGFTTMPVNFQKTEVEFHDFSPEATLSFHPQRDINIDATYREGYTAGGFNETAFGRAGSDNSFRPESVSGGEFGIKGRALDGALGFDATVYHYK
jgi:iron complex outermembrane receptor protein